jgi:serine O-acetyltransferase
MLILRAFAQQPGTRTVFYHRLWRGTVGDRLLCVLLKRLYRGQVGVELYCDDIGPGFVLAHGQGAIIGALRIGRDCTIHQEVAIGLLDGDVGSRPTIGDRVWIYPGARVVGCNLADDCTVGTNAVVLEDLPAGRTAFAPPARLAPY